MKHTATQPASGVVLLAAVALCAGILAVYFNSLRTPFVFDDMASILDNPTIRRLERLGDVLSPPAGGSGVTGRPIVNLTLAVNFALSGTSTWSYHLLNVLCHAATTLLVFGAVRRVLSESELAARWAAVATPVAVGAAGWFGLHPLQTESVVCIIQRTELLVGFFLLLTLYAFVRGAGSPRPRGWLTLSVVACALGMGSKEVMVVAPVLVMLLDRSCFAGSVRAAWSRRRGYYVALAATWLVLLFLLVRGGGSRGAAAGFGLGVPWWAYALKQCEAIWLYLKLALWPHPLVVDYGDEVVWRVGEVWLQGAGLVVLLAIVAMGVWQRRAWGFLGAFFICVLAPSSSVVPLVTQSVAEHRMYLPLAALGVAIAAGVNLLWRGCGRWVAVAGAAGFAGIVAARNQDFTSELRLWQRTVARQPQNARAHNLLGLSLMAAGRRAEAKVEFEAALRLRPDSADYRSNLANALLVAGDASGAIAESQRALKSNPASVEALNNLGNALGQLGRQTEALAAYQTAARLKPESAELQANLANTMIELGRFPEAVAYGERAVWLRPDSPDAQHNLAVALLRQQRFAEAEAHAVAATRIAPGLALARNTLAIIYANTNRLAQAITEFEAAVRLKPDYDQARSNLEAARRMQANGPRTN